MRAELRALLIAALVVYATAIWWGVPWLWGPDELSPESIIGGMEKSFTGGWHDKYPPVQYYLDALVCLPIVIATRAGWGNPASLGATILMQVLMRLLSVAMALGTLVAIYRTADDLYGRRGAFAATLLAGFTPPVVFYAKLANVDAPSLLWFAWAIRFYVRAVREGGSRTLLAYGLTAATAIATKDQVAGFFVLPSVHLAWLASRRHEWRPLLTAGGVSLVLLVFELGIPFNARGFASHVRMITGEASQPFRLHASSAGALQLLIARLTVKMIAWSMTWVGFAAGLIGLILQLRERRFLWLALPIVSYYVLFLVPLGYVYDRFLIGICFILAIFAGGWVAALLRPGAPQLRWRAAACAAGAAFVLWSGVSMDVMMILDSRHDVARWLDSHRGGGLVAQVGLSPYLPYIPGAVRLLDPPDAFEAGKQPKYIVVNAEVMRREYLPRVERAWQQWLDSGRSPYVVAARFKTAPAASYLTYTDVFRNGIEDGGTNLDKVGPEFVVYWRPGTLR